MTDPLDLDDIKLQYLSGGEWVLASAFHIGALVAEVERLRKIETAAEAVCDEWYYGGEAPSDSVARRLCGVVEDLAATLNPEEPS